MTPTATNTPPVSAVVFRLTVRETPIAGAPIQINDTTQHTDRDGQISTFLNVTQFHSISSGVEAISFSTLYDSGANFAAQSPITIAATRLMSGVSDPCRVLVGGVSNIYFTCVNTTDRVLAVPLENPSADPSINLSLNSLYGDPSSPPPAPPVNFAPGTTGFTVPESFFASGGGWQFLGQNITISASPPVCADQGIPNACAVIDQELLRGPFDHTKEVVISLTNDALKAARVGRWKPAGGKFSVPFLKRGGVALASMEKVFRDSKTQNFACEVTPMSCRTTKVPKKALIRAFLKIFEGKVPRGLEHIQARSKRERRRFEAHLKALPDEYTTCP